MDADKKEPPAGFYCPKRFFLCAMHTEPGYTLCSRVQKALTKSMLCQRLKNHADQGSELAKKGAYQDVSDRILQAMLTMKAKFSAYFVSFTEIFAFAGFVSNL